MRRHTVELSFSSVRSMWRGWQEKVLLNTLHPRPFVQTKDDGHLHAELSCAQGIIALVVGAGIQCSSVACILMEHSCYSFAPWSRYDLESELSFTTYSFCDFQKPMYLSKPLSLLP